MVGERVVSVCYDARMKTDGVRLVWCLVLILPAALHGQEPKAPRPATGYVTLKDFRFASGEKLPVVKMHFRTFGTPRRGPDGKVNNAVLILHGTGGDGTTFLRPIFAGELFGAGQPLDASQYYLIIPDNLGHGRSTRPSEGLKARFPRYGYRDMIAAQKGMLAELKVDHLRLVFGTSMGGMHTWLWGQLHPDFMDGLMPLASLPTQISGRNRMWRKLISDAIRGDPEWKEGEYEKQPRSLRTAAQMLQLMSLNPILMHQAAPTLKEADALQDRYVSDYLARGDANNLLYAVEASWDYDPGPGLERIQAPLLAINFADDLINPPELGILEREIKRVPRGEAVLMPLSADTVGHGSHTKAVLWKDRLARFLKQTTK